MAGWIPPKMLCITPQSSTDATICPALCAERGGSSCVVGARGRITSASPWMPTITSASSPAIKSTWESSPARWGFPVISASTAGERASLFQPPVLLKVSFIATGEQHASPLQRNLVHRLAVGLQRDLQLQNVAVLAEAERDLLHRADVTRLPIWRFERLAGLVGQNGYILRSGEHTSGLPSQAKLRW